MTNQKIAEIFADSKRKKIIIAAAVVMVVVIVALTLHLLILPAVTMERTPICGIEEHQHTDECYREEKVLVCTLPEDENHHHTDECYTVQKVLVCEKQEHVHTADCFEKSDPKADREDEKAWKQSVAKAKLTENWADNLVAVAKTQIDYMESEKNFVWSENGKKMGYTRYGDFMGNKYAEWSNMFTAFSLNYANVPYDLVPYKLPVSKWIERLKTNGLFEDREKARPLKGDIVFLDKDSDSKADSTAIVEEVKESKKNIDFTVIEGDVDDKVKEVNYNLKDKEIIGFGKISKAQTLVMVPEPVKNTVPNLYATKTGNYYKQVRSFNELKNNDNLLIISVEGDYALTNNKGNTGYTNVTQIDLSPVKGNPDYYTVDKAPSNAVWKYRNRAIENSGYRLDLRYGNALFAPSNQTINLDFKTSNTAGCWTLSTYDGYYGYTYFLNNNGNTFLSSTYSKVLSGNLVYAKTNDMLILKEVRTTLTIPEDPEPPQGIGAQPGSAVKPNYPKYIDVSDKVEGNSNFLGADFEYKSDPSTSQIESKFGYHVPGFGKLDYDAQKVDDGKTLTDKSVIYNKDDYGAFKNYEADEFSVTLSALGQTFAADTYQEKIPIDVLFVLDLSGSMNNIYGDQKKPRAEILVDSMNKTIDNILKSNPENRVCAVGYNSNVTELLPLGRPHKNSQNQYFKFIRKSSGEFYVEHQINVVDNNKTVTCQYGTYTQLGIAKGVELLNSNPDTTVTINVHGESVEVERKPVIILVSDGEPTHCTNHYMDVINSPYYGDGIGDVPISGSDDVENPKGILGYYTILSANYYKRMAGIHYDNPAAMYTVAFGMVEKNTGHAGSSAATKHYCATIMNPTPDNIEYLNSIAKKPGTNKYAGQIEGQLYSLLKGTNKEEVIEIGSYYDLVNLGSPHAHVPVNLNNPYKNNYNYSDKAFLGNEGSEGLDAAFNEIIDLNSFQYVEHMYETLNHQPIVISDPVGEGMQIKGDPVLRINGKNYQPTSKPVRNGVQYYEYKHGTVLMDDYSNLKIDMNKIEVRVEKDSAGNQKVYLSIPDNALPVYSSDQTMSFYYEALPIRLLYKVGLTDEAKTQVEKLAPGQTLTYYTNRYQGSEHANSKIAPARDNSFYNKSGWKQNVSKTDNTTLTDAHSLIVGGRATSVDHSLGNNGKLVFSKPAIKKTLSIEKKWLDYNGEVSNENLPENISGTLYRTYEDEQSKTKKEDVLKFTLNAENNWKKTFTYEELNEDPSLEYKYYVNEDELEGYKVKYEADGISINTPDTPIIITNRYKFGDIILPSTGGAGTTILYVLGAVLIIGALGYGYVLIRNKKKNDSK